MAMRDGIPCDRRSLLAAPALATTGASAFRQKRTPSACASSDPLVLGRSPPWARSTSWSSRCATVHLATSMPIRAIPRANDGCPAHDAADVRQRPSSKACTASASGSAATSCRSTSRPDQSKSSCWCRSSVPAVTCRRRHRPGGSRHAADRLQIPRSVRARVGDRTPLRRALVNRVGGLRLYAGRRSDRDPIM